MSTPPNQDIPAARRQSSTAAPATPVVVQKQRGHWGKAFGILSLIAIAILCIWQRQSISQQTALQAQRLQKAIHPRDRSANAQATRLDANSSSQSLPVSATDRLSVTPSKGSPDHLLNHRRYAEADPTDLVPLDPSSQLKLQRPAQIAVSEMMAQARSEGVQLGVASAFRSVEDQTHLFFDVKAERGQNSKTRAEVSAPPGYSEHHTGYAVDFIDESEPNTNTEESFENTSAYQWLKQNAPAYSFEMSFPKAPNSLVSYEPWHWRYVGDQKSLELFYEEQTPAPSSTSQLAPTP